MLKFNPLLEDGFQYLNESEADEFGKIEVSSPSGDIEIDDQDLQDNWAGKYVITASNTTNINLVFNTLGAYTEDWTIYIVNRNIDQEIEVTDDEGNYVFYQGSYNIRDRAGNTFFKILAGGVVRIRFDIDQDCYYVNGDVYDTDLASVPASIELPPFNNVRLVSTNNIAGLVYSSSSAFKNLTGTGIGPISIDGVTPSSLDIILLQGQTVAQQNGIYRVSSNAANVILTRVKWQNSSSEYIKNTAVFVTEGDDYAGTIFRYTGPSNLDPDTTAQNWVQNKIDSIGGDIDWVVEGALNNNVTLNRDLRNQNVFLSINPYITPNGNYQLKYVTTSNNVNNNASWDAQIYVNNGLVYTLNVSGNYFNIASVPAGVFSTTSDEIRVRVSNITGTLQRPSIRAYWEKIS